MKVVMILASIASWTILVNAEESARCHQIKRENIDMQERVSKQETIQENLENWCYQRKDNGDLFIYNGDNEQVFQELAMTVTQKGTIIHSSLKQGELSTHEVQQSEINPLNIPLQEPEDADSAAFAPTPAQASSAELAYEKMRTAVPEKHVYRAVTEGEILGAADILPWRGFTWSFNDHELFAGAEAPLNKYDNFVMKRSDESPGTVAWESEHHAVGQGWGGHCNGWASGAILRKEPAQPLFDSESDIRFKISDLKGLIAVKDYCAKVAVYGYRNSSSTVDRVDVNPVIFHKVLLYFVGETKKPVAIDIRPNKVINTQVVSAYKMNVQNRGGGNYRVTARLTLHKYLKHPDEIVGPAPSYTRIYRYNLHVDSDGEIDGGTWLSENPDFLYVPLSPGVCPDRHVGMEERWLKDILGLPEAGIRYPNELVGRPGLEPGIRRL